MKSILVITSSYDKTIDFIIHKFDKLSFIRINVDELSDYNISLTTNGIILKSSKYCSNDLYRDINSIYFRKIFLPDLDKYDKEYHNYMQKEIYSFIVGFANSFEGKVLTKPYLLRNIENKIFQFTLSQKLGFTLPQTIISNDKLLVNNNTKINEWIIKPISSGKTTESNLVFTNILDREVSNIQLSPAYFQKKIFKQYELRITVINNHFYCVKILSQIIDWRNDENIKYELIEIPNIVKQQCLVFMKKVDLSFATFDYIYDGINYYFLECNPNGQWLWLEKILNLDISNKIVEFLNA